MRIRFGKETIELDSALLDGNNTILELKKILLNNLQENEQGSLEHKDFESLKKADYDIKLIYNGKLLHDDVLLNAIPGGIHSKLVMLASKLNAEEKTSIPKAEHHIRDDLQPSGKDSVTRKQRKMPARREVSQYGFRDIQELPGLPRSDEARQILTSLANDPGIQAVMNKYKWSVGALCEMFPEGYVGVSDVCVMGLNENHGQRILLRIRTDDLLGFRKILSIKKVLYHELSHNVHSEHGDAFYILMRQIERDANELDWTKSSGRQLVEGSVYSSTMSSSAPSAEDREPKVFRLGGGDLLDGVTLVAGQVKASVLAGLAATIRLTEEERETELACSTRSDHVVDESEYLVEAEEASGREPPPYDDGLEARSKQESVVEQFKAIDRETEPINTIEESSRGVEVEEKEKERRKRRKAMEGVDEAIVMALSADSPAASATADRLLRLGESLAKALHLPEHGDLQAAHSCLKLIGKILQNAMTLPDPKYKTLKCSTQSFQRTIAPVDGAVDVLLTAGFRYDEDRQKLVLPAAAAAADPALLYLVHSIIEQILQLLEGES